MINSRGLAKRSRALLGSNLLGSNPTRNSQTDGAPQARRKRVGLRTIRSQALFHSLRTPEPCLKKSHNITAGEAVLFCWLRAQPALRSTSDPASEF